MFQYGNYRLDDCTRYDLSDRQVDLLDACIWLVDNRSSIRLTAKNFCTSKSYLHRGIHGVLPKLSSELYNCVKKQLKINQAHRCSGRSW